MAEDSQLSGCRFEPAIYWMVTAKLAITLEKEKKVAERNKSKKSFKKLDVLSFIQAR
jgi:hypothetical protein